jgi:hypothetical protein
MVQTYATWCKMMPSRSKLNSSMARTLISHDRKTVRTSVMLPEDAHLQVQALADANQVSTAWVIRAAVQRFLDEHQGQLELPLRFSARFGSNSQ